MLRTTAPLIGALGMTGDGVLELHLIVIFAAALGCILSGTLARSRVDPDSATFAMMFAKGDVPSYRTTWSLRLKLLLPWTTLISIPDLDRIGRIAIYGARFFACMAVLGLVSLILLGLWGFEA